MTKRGDYDYWNGLLNGEPIDVIPGRAEPGYYRRRERDGSIVGVQIWRQSNGKLGAKIGHGKHISIDHEDEFVERVFAWCCRNAVEPEAYRDWLKTGSWPDSLPDVQEAVAEKVGANAPPEVMIEETVDELLREMNRWLKSIGGKVETQEHADKAANFASRFAELEKEADKNRTAEKKPHHERVKAIDTKWKPIENKAGDAKRRAKSLTTDFLNAERARKLAEAAEKAARGEAVRADETKVKAGTRAGSVALRTRNVGTVVDAVAFAQYLAEIKNPDMVALLNTIAQRLASAGAQAPGITIEQKTVAA